MKINILNYCGVILFTLLHTNSMGQNIEKNVFLQLDFSPRWIWRGISYSDGPVIQPTLGFENNKFKATVWGSYQINPGEYQEIDFSVEYAFTDYLKIGITDFFAINNTDRNNQKFFNLNASTTSHLFDLYANIKPFPKTPVSLTVSNWFYGADKDTITKKQNFSSYLEIRYAKQLTNMELYGFVGGTLHKGFYSNKANIVNVGFGCSKNYEVTKWMIIPFKVEFTLNPSTKNIYLNTVIGIR